MAVTTPDAIYEAILGQIRFAIAPAPLSMGETRANIMPVTAFHAIAFPFVQLIAPGTARLPDADSGVGYVVEDFSIAVFEKISRDETGSTSVSIANSGRSIIRICNAIRGDAKSSPSGLINFFPGGENASINIVNAI